MDGLYQRYFRKSSGENFFIGEVFLSGARDVPPETFLHAYKLYTHAHNTMAGITARYVGTTSTNPSSSWQCRITGRRHRVYFKKERCCCVFLAQHLSHHLQSPQVFNMVVEIPCWTKAKQQISKGHVTIPSNRTSRGGLSAAVSLIMVIALPTMLFRKYGLPLVTAFRMVLAGLLRDVDSNELLELGRSHLSPKSKRRQ